VDSDVERGVAVLALHVVVGTVLQQEADLGNQLFYCLGKNN
jgi:hypothetical protein